MRVASYEAHHVLGVKDVRFDMAGRHLVLVGGDNGQGKTSALTALLMALCGRSGFDYPDVALKDGETEGWVKVDLQGDDGERGLTVELFLKRQRGGTVAEKLRVVDDEGNTAKEPRSLLGRLYNLRAFDPLEFERMDRKAKRALLCDLLGLDFAAEDQERKRLFDERTAMGRDGAKAAAKLAALPKPDSPSLEEVSVARLLDERKAMEAVNRRNKADRDRLEATRKDLMEKREEIGSLDARVDDLLRQVATLQREREELVSQSENLALLEKAQALTAEALEDHDLAGVDARIAQAEEVNRQVRTAKLRAETEAEVEELRKQYQRLTEEIERIDLAKDEALRNAQWPIEGLGIDAEGVTFGGLPFEQASKSKRILTSTLIGMALNPKLKLLVCQDGNDLGTQALEDLEALLAERGYQMLLEVVTRSPADEARCAVVIEDGAVKGA